jgi:hypothetical protein
MKTITKSSIALSTTIASLIRSLSIVATSTFLATLPVNAQTENFPSQDANCYKGEKGFCIKVNDVKLSVDDKYVVTFQITKQEDGRSFGEIKPEQISVSIVNGKGALKSGELKKLEAGTIPLRVVILLDYSGSMKAKDQSGRISKLDGATSSIRKFIDRFPSDADVKFSVVPFGAKCANSDIQKRLLFNEMDIDRNNQLLGNFYSRDSAPLSNLINTLANGENIGKCGASTNLYQATAIAMNFIAQKDNKELYPQEKNKPQPKLVLIVFTDGFNTEPLRASDQRDYQADICNNIESDLNELTSKSYKNINIYALGYGKDPKDFTCKKNLVWDNYPYALNDNQIKSSEFLDKKALEKIATWGNGFSALGGKAEDIDKIFQQIFEAISGGYDLYFTDADSDAGEQRNIKVSFTNNGNTVSDIGKYSITAYKPMEIRDRLLWLGGGVFAFLVLGGIPFWFWRNTLSE